MKKQWFSALILVVSAFLALGTGESDDSPPSPTTRQSEARVATQSERLDIRVTSTGVKRIDGKYRYFFSIANHDDVSYEGNVRIRLKTQGSGLQVGNETLSTNRPIVPGGARSTYLTINTGPVSIHGSNGVDRFQFEVTSRNVVVASGTGYVLAN